MPMDNPDFTVEKLGQARTLTPMSGMRFVSDTEKMLYSSSLEDVKNLLAGGIEPAQMEKAGPREKIFFDPSKIKAGIVTCGGLCPGLNDVIRAIVMSLVYHYGVRAVYGFKYGYEGLSPKYRHTPLELTTDKVSRIHEQGGSILGSSRGNQDSSEMVDTLEQMNINILFTIGGDGTQRGALAICEEIKRRGLKIAVVGIPKTIDNDISFVTTSFGFETACSEARHIIAGANAEAMGARNGVGLVKLMGRDSGFIAAYSTMANNDVNFCMVPEVPFSLEGFLSVLEDRLNKKGHAVIVVAEGAGQELLSGKGAVDASGNKLHADIGSFLRDKIKEHFSKQQVEVNLKYIDPSYTIRSLSANAHDAAFCLLLGHNAVHAAMTGRTGMLVGHWKGDFTHVPISLAISERKKLDAQGWLWRSVLSTTGQPACMM